MAPMGAVNAFGALSNGLPNSGTATSANANAIANATALPLPICGAAVCAWCGADCGEDAHAHIVACGIAQLFGSTTNVVSGGGDASIAAARASTAANASPSVRSSAGQPAVSAIRPAVTTAAVAPASAAATTTRTDTAAAARDGANAAIGAFFASHEQLARARRVRQTRAVAACVAQLLAMASPGAAVPATTAATSGKGAAAAGAAGKSAGNQAANAGGAKVGGLIATAEQVVGRVVPEADWTTAVRNAVLTSHELAEARIVAPW
jgi:hypothetical protein